MPRMQASPRRTPSTLMGTVMFALPPPEVPPPDALITAVENRVTVPLPPPPPREEPPLPLPPPEETFRRAAEAPWARCYAAEITAPD